MTTNSIRVAANPLEDADCQQTELCRTCFGTGREPYRGQVKNSGWMSPPEYLHCEDCDGTGRVSYGSQEGGPHER